MDYRTDMGAPATPRSGIADLNDAELDAVAGGASTSSYNVFYTLGYWMGEAVAWMGGAIEKINSSYAQGVEQSNGAILAYM